VQLISRKKPDEEENFDILLNEIAFGTTRNANQRNRK
jgi:hypothetical protein